jgi:hypothetical protein
LISKGIEMKTILTQLLIMLSAYAIGQYLSDTYASGWFALLVGRIICDIVAPIKVVYVKEGSKDDKLP